MHQYAIFYGAAALAVVVWCLTFRYGSARAPFLAILGAVLGGLVLWAWQVSEPSILFSDFNVAYYPAGRAILEDIPHLFVRCWDTPVCGFVNIPIVAFLFTPFSMLTLRHAHWLFAGLSLLSLVISVGLLWSMTDRVASRRWGIVALFMTSGPLLYSLKEGNLTHFALLLLIAGVVCLDKTWDRSAGGCFALAAIIKLPLLLFAVYFFGKRRWAAVFGYGLTLLAVTGLS
ncbi:MAG: glycosyltransferase family 87 protein, partial [Nitrospira sp.]